jgi:hypothetical protein
MALTKWNDELQKKFNQLKANRFSINFRNHLFEMQVLGCFAKADVIKNIEVSIANHPSTIDAEIVLHERSVFVEITYTSQEILNPSSPAFQYVDWNGMFQAVKDKMLKKVGSGKQLGLVHGSPCILIIGRNQNGPDSVHTEEAAKDAFGNSDFSKLSLLIDANSWCFLRSRMHKNSNASVPLLETEISRLAKLISE